MTARYTLFQIDAIRDRFAPVSGVPKGVTPSYNISPAASVPVIVERDGSPVIETMKWGFIPARAKDTNSIFRYKTFIARSEGIFDKPTWGASIRSQRCLIPANGFYEWKVTKSGKRPFYIRPIDCELFAFAGIYSSWTDPAGIDYGICAIITTASGAETDLIPSRLPVILDPTDEADWLNPAIGDINTLYKIMRPYDPNKLTIVPVSDDVNNKKANTSYLIDRITPTA